MADFVEIVKILIEQVGDFPARGRLAYLPLIKKYLLFANHREKVKGYWQMCLHQEQHISYMCIQFQELLSSCKNFQLHQLVVTALVMPFKTTLQYNMDTPGGTHPGDRENANCTSCTLYNSHFLLGMSLLLRGQV